MKLLRLSTILAAAFFSTSAATDETEDPTIQKYPELVKWFTTHGGLVDPRITLGYEESSRIRGMIATEHIEPGTVLVHTPASLMIKENEREHQYTDHCAMIQRIVEEIELGKDSKWDVFFQFDGSDPEGGGIIPTQWDKEDQPGSRAIKELQGLPPTGETHRHIDWYTADCNNGQEVSEVQLRALILFISRSADCGIVPVYHLLNHHNGLINTHLTVDEENGLSVIATTAIEPNEPIYLTYARGGFESTIDVFNNYGFVEDYPQLWRWSDMDFEILVVSPTLAALHPTETLKQVLGNGRRSMEEWKVEIDHHHATVRQSHANAMHGSALTILSELNTTLAEDEDTILPNERRLFEKAKKKGRVDQSKADTIQAIEYRLAFKKALRLAVDVADGGKFYADSEEL
jgi:hypothetical protein